jgi:4-hydroxy-3-polyprenylbenzoate decarboxylase
MSRGSLRKLSDNQKMAHPNQGRNLTVAMTGASGALFTAAMLQLLDADERVGTVHFIASDHALRVVSEELAPTGRSGLLEALLGGPGSGKIRSLRNDDVGAPVASGSYPSDGMIVLPCSMGTLASIANGLAARLIDRAADVSLKERRPLILCVRETPFNRIHLRNMTLAAEAGATIYPVIPALYFRPPGLDEIARQFCCRVLSHVGLPQPEAYQWKADE